MTSEEKLTLTSRDSWKSVASEVSGIEEVSLFADRELRQMPVQEKAPSVQWAERKSRKEVG